MAADLTPNEELDRELAAELRRSQPMLATAVIGIVMTGGDWRTIQASIGPGRRLSNPWLAVAVEAYFRVIWRARNARLN